MSSTTNLGNYGEQLVATWLGAQGFSILERNYKKKYGEIDLIAQKKDLIVFVEVKMRSISYFDPAQSITISKQKKIIMVAQEYLMRHNGDDNNCRFDVALIEIVNNEPKLTYLQNAFE